MTDQSAPLGEINKHLYLRQEFCTATDEVTGAEYHYAVSLGGGDVVISNSATNKQWVVTARRLIDVARQEGLDEEDETP